MHWDDLRFWIAVAAFFVMTAFYLSERGHTAALYRLVDGAQAIASNCINHQQTRIDDLEDAVNGALTGRNADE